MNEHSGWNTSLISWCLYHGRDPVSHFLSCDVLTSPLTQRKEERKWWLVNGLVKTRHKENEIRIVSLVNDWPLGHRQDRPIQPKAKRIGCLVYVPSIIRDTFPFLMRQCWPSFSMFLSLLLREKEKERPGLIKKRKPVIYLVINNGPNRSFSFFLSLVKKKG